MVQPIRYALVCPEFRFRALAAVAGRAPIGGEREIVLACLQLGRLCAGNLPPYSMAPDVAAGRIEHTRQWLSALAIPQGMRTVAGRILEALAVGDRAGVADVLADLVVAATPQLDDSSRAELDGLIHDFSVSVATGIASSKPIDVHLQAS